MVDRFLFIFYLGVCLAGVSLSILFQFSLCRDFCRDAWSCMEWPGSKPEIAGRRYEEEGRVGMEFLERDIISCVYLGFTRFLFVYYISNIREQAIVLSITLP